MSNIMGNLINAVKNSVLSTKGDAENQKESLAGNPPQSCDSQSSNNCSLPKNEEQFTENQNEKQHPEMQNESPADKLKNDLAKLTGKNLNIEYESEYKAWSNSKYRAGKLKGIKGKKYDDQLAAFPSFLAHVGPKPNKDDSLDRIDPDYGYVVGNVRWANKKLQSQNRKFVKEFNVNGKAMNLEQIAHQIGISYDALRRRIERGADLQQIVKDLQFKAPVTAQTIKRIIECPWPDGKEAVWEANFKAQAASLCPHSPKSRCVYYAAKCNQYLEALKLASADYGYDPLPEELTKKIEYWMMLREDAAKKSKLVELHRNLLPSLDITKDELEMREVLGL